MSHQEGKEDPPITTKEKDMKYLLGILTATLMVSSAQAVDIEVGYPYSHLFDVTYEKIMKDFNRDYWMDAQESVDYGIVDGILE